RVLRVRQVPVIDGPFGPGTARSSVRRELATGRRACARRASWPDVTRRARRCDRTDRFVAGGGEAVLASTARADGSAGYGDLRTRREFHNGGKEQPRAVREPERYRGSGAEGRPGQLRQLR